MIDEVFEVAGPDGQIRRGMLSLPGQGAPKSALLLLTAGVKYRTGPGQLYVALARRLAARGIATLRFDALGIGESDGTLEAGPSHEHWISAEAGRFVPDCVLAFNAIAARWPATPVYLGGLCGGGLTALLTSVEIGPRAAGLMSINIAARGTVPPGKPVALVASESRVSLKSYPRKMLSPDAWKRVLTGATSIDALAQTITKGLGLGSKQKLDDSLNPKFVAAMRRARATKLRHLMIFSGTDVRWFHFKDLVLGPLFDGKLDGPLHQTRVVEGAEHHLYLSEWRDEAAGWIAEFMRA